MAHHDSHLLAQGGPVTMNRAFRAGRFPFLERALVEAPMRVLNQLPASFTKPIPRAV
jgi:hypothetical protein